MIDIKQTEELITQLAAACGARVYQVGYSEKSDSIYINIRKPKEISAEYGVMDDWCALVRVSNHYNHTNTHDSLTADLYLNLSDIADTDDVLDQLREFLTACECINVD